MKTNLTLAILLLTSALLYANNNAAPDILNREVVFSPNKGQVTDQTGKPVNNVLATCHLQGLSLYVTTNGVTYVLRKYEEDKAAPGHPVYINQKQYKVNYSRVDIALAGANITKSQLSFAGEATFKTNYYRNGNAKGQLAVASYKTLTIANIYPGIDWVWKSTADGQLDYDFVVHAGANPLLIQMQYKYADLQPEGNKLNILTRNGTLVEGELKATCDQNPVTVDYKHNKLTNTIGFGISAYNTAATLVIDPPLSLQWSTQYGGTFSDGFRGVETDSLGNVYITGYSMSTDFPVVNAGGSSYFDGTYNGNSDVTVTKIKSDTLQWVTYLGGAGNDYGNSISVGKDNAIYVTGMAAGGFPVINLSGAYNQPTATGADAFICKFNQDLSLNWSTFYGGDGTDEALKVMCYYNDVYIAGYTNSQAATFPLQATPGLDFHNTVTQTEGFFVRFDSAGVRSWATTWGGSGDDYITTLLPSEFGGITIAGFTTSSNIPVALSTSAVNNQYQGGTDAFVAHLNGNVMFVSGTTYYGGSGNDYITDGVKAVNNYVLFSGYTNSPDFLGNGMGGYDAFILTEKSWYQTYGTGYIIDWTRTISGSDDDIATAIAIDENDRVFVTGFTLSNNLPVLQGAFNNAFYQDTLGGASDGFIAGYSMLGTQFWCTYKGTTCIEYCNDIAYDSVNSQLYVVGEGINFCGAGGLPPDPDAFVTSFNGPTSDVSASCPQPVVNILQPACGVDTCNGIAEVTITGGTPPYNIFWMGQGNQNNVRINFCATPYPVELYVEDYMGCTAVSGFRPNGTTISNLTYDLDCKDSIPYLSGYVSNTDINTSYEWYYNGVLVSQNVNFPQLTGPGHLQLIVTSANCVVEDTITIKYNDHTTSNSITGFDRPTCGNSNGTLYVSLDNTIGDSYTWVQPQGLPVASGSIGGLPPGTYIMDTRACANGQRIYDTVVLYSSAVQAMYTANAIMCNGGLTTVNISATGGSLPYSGTGSFIAPAGSHTYIVSDMDGCADTLVVTLTQPAALQANYVAGSIACNGGNTNILISAIGGTGPYTGTGNFTAPAGSGIYIVTDNSGCADTVQITLTEPAALQAGYSAGTIACNGGTAIININATGGTMPYNGIGSFTTPAGNYSYIVTDNAGCADTLDIAITEPAVLQAGYSAGIIACNGGTATINVNATGGTMPYNGTGSFTSPAGNYSFVVTDNAGCADTLHIAVTEPPLLEANYTAGEILCYNNPTTVNITATGGTLPYTGTGNFTAAAGNSHFVIMDNAGCTDTVDITINQPAALYATITAPDSINCSQINIPIVVGVTGGTSPYTGAGNVNVPANSAYTLHITDANNCTYDTVLNIALSQDTFKIIGPNDTPCLNQQVVLTTAGAIPANWQPAGTTASTYTFVSTQQTTVVWAWAYTGNCYVTDTLTITATQCNDTTGIADGLQAADWLVYPNPANTFWLLNFKQPLPTNVGVNLYTSEGRLINYGTAQQGELLYKVDCSQLANGIYILKLGLSNTAVNLKVAVHR